jgi:hypothetical protein
MESRSHVMINACIEKYHLQPTETCVRTQNYLEICVYRTAGTVLIVLSSIIY